MTNKTDILINIFGWIGSILLTLNLIPQIYKIHKTHKAEDISSTFLIVNTMGLIMYSFYGWYYRILQVAVSTSISALMCIYIMILKIKCDKDCACKVSVQPPV